ncbi:hypothetical protein [Mangrovibacterium sp.]|uniref:hypothetical protein n=1 Tax=Mangrovibacterium sp. TaxID=1961364 RepID=UPI00356514CF
MKNLYRLLFVVFTVVLFGSCTPVKKENFDLSLFLDLADPNVIYPTSEQLELLKKVVPEEAFIPVPPVSNRLYWDSVASVSAGKTYLDLAIAELDRAPEVPITDEIYYRANREGNRGIYKPRYYRTMDRLEKFILAECIENQGRFLPQIEVYSDSIMAMKSWLHPNHDRDNDVLEGRRVSIDLGARKFGLVLALANALLEDKIPASLRSKIDEQLQWRITDSYLSSCQKEEDKSNTWIRSTSNWNSVCTSGSVFTTIVNAKSYDERVAAIGCALNSMVFYLSGFGTDGYCSEGTGYWNYGFGHYMYLSEILSDYTDGQINLFDFTNREKMVNVGNFPFNFQIHPGMYAPFSDGVTTLDPESDNFAYIMAAKHYGAKKPTRFIPDESVQTLIAWKDKQDYTSSGDTPVELPGHTYFDDFGIMISRGQQELPFSIAIKAGHNGENHNHMDVGSYVLVLGEDYVAGDIGAPSYTAGAFSNDNPARSSWGHPLPRINNTLQSSGKEFAGEIVHAEFADNANKVVMDIRSAYEIPSLNKLQRTMTNDKRGPGTITVTDEFSATEPLSFGTAISTFSKYELVDERTLILTAVKNQGKVKVEVFGEVAGEDVPVKIVPEPIPVKSLRSGKDAVRIGVEFIEEAQSGSISIKYQPILN